MASAVMYPSVTQAGEWSEQAPVQPQGMFLGTPEIYFPKRIDNSRVMKVADPKRRREMITFAATLCLFFLLVMVYLWQHFSAIEYGYQNEQLKSQRDTIIEANRALSLEESSLTHPARIEDMARQLGMQRPAYGQWELMDTGTVDSTPIMAKASGGIMVVSTQP